ncbi:MAG TPA: hypothetical protein VF768_08735, partial [Holophagaceae bacterium]
LDAPPPTILVQDELTPRSPWSFLRASLPGGFTRWGWGLVAGWILALAGPAFSWAVLLRKSAGWSALPNHWGEGLTARDIWELWENGGLKHHAVNSPTVHTLGLGVILVLWCGWRLQAEAAGLPARLTPWLLGALDALLIGMVPVIAVAWAVISTLGSMGDSGIQGLGWLAFLGRPIVVMAAVSALNLQWWFLRMSRARRAASGARGRYLRHLGWNFQALWAHPVQWTVLVLGGSVIRAGLAFLALFLAWRMGGATVGRVWIFFLLQVAVAAFNAWLMGWFLRTAARFWQHDLKVREARAELVEARRAAKLLEA